MLWLPQEEGQGLVEYALILVLWPSSSSRYWRYWARRSAMSSPESSRDCRVPRSQPSLGQ